MAAENNSNVVIPSVDHFIKNYGVEKFISFIDACEARPAFYETNFGFEYGRHMNWKFTSAGKKAWKEIVDEMRDRQITFQDPAYDYGFFMDIWRRLMDFSRIRDSMFYDNMEFYRKGNWLQLERKKRIKESREARKAGEEVVTGKAALQAARKQQRGEGRSSRARSLRILPNPAVATAMKTIKKAARSLGGRVAKVARPRKSQVDEQPTAEEGSTMSVRHEAVEQPESARRLRKRIEKPKSEQPPRIRSASANQWTLRAANGKFCKAPEPLQAYQQIGEEARNTESASLGLEQAGSSTALVQETMPVLSPQKSAPENSFRAPVQQTEPMPKRSQSRAPKRAASKSRIPEGTVQALPDFSRTPRQENGRGEIMPVLIPQIAESIHVTATPGPLESKRSLPESIPEIATPGPSKPKQSQKLTSSRSRTQQAKPTLKRSQSQPSKKVPSKSQAQEDGATPQVVPEQAKPKPNRSQSQVPRRAPKSRNSEATSMSQAVPVEEPTPKRSQIKPLKRALSKTPALPEELQPISSQALPEELPVEQPTIVKPVPKRNQTSRASSRAPPMPEQDQPTSSQRNQISKTLSISEALPSEQPAVTKPVPKRSQTPRAPSRPQEDSGTQAIPESFSMPQPASVDQLLVSNPIPKLTETPKRIRAAEGRGTTPAMPEQTKPKPKRSQTPGNALSKSRVLESSATEEAVPLKQPQLATTENQIQSENPKSRPTATQFQRTKHEQKRSQTPRAPSRAEEAENVPGPSRKRSVTPSTSSSQEPPAKIPKPSSVVAPKQPYTTMRPSRKRSLSLIPSTSKTESQEPAAIPRQYQTAAPVELQQTPGPSQAESVEPYTSQSQNRESKTSIPKPRQPYTTFRPSRVRSLSLGVPSTSYVRNQERPVARVELQPTMRPSRNGAQTVLPVSQIHMPQAKKTVRSDSRVPKTPSTSISLPPPPAKGILKTPTPSPSAASTSNGTLRNGRRISFAPDTRGGEDGQIDIENLDPVNTENAPRADLESDLESWESEDEPEEEEEPREKNEEENLYYKFREEQFEAELLKSEPEDEEYIDVES
ncbi:hypothetical protein L596_019658 [Steinernema carpocapsae]|uniref:Uncharacterized protein n=1 Tax=Steinernema carpocapsae TaxID=34508 RepID=A0A4U5MR62_STECR|nr:hypothetical protein L596_019658 [Steinernema carpocapsae]